MTNYLRELYGPGGVAHPSDDDDDDDEEEEEEEEEEATPSYRSRKRWHH